MNKPESKDPLLGREIVPVRHVLRRVMSVPKQEGGH
jgi:hypothetical protein